MAGLWRWLMAWWFGLGLVGKFSQLAGSDEKKFAANTTRDVPVFLLNEFSSTASRHEIRQISIEMCKTEEYQPERSG